MNYEMKFSHNLINTCLKSALHTCMDANKEVDYRLGRADWQGRNGGFGALSFAACLPWCHTQENKSIPYLATKD